MTTVIESCCVWLRKVRLQILVQDGHFGENAVDIFLNYNFRHHTLTRERSSFSPLSVNSFNLMTKIAKKIQGSVQFKTSVLT